MAGEKGKRIRKRYSDHRGFSLVELICTVAIFSIVITGVGSAMVLSARSYQNGNVELDLQQQAQITSNLLTNLILDADSLQIVTEDGIEKLKLIKQEGPDTVDYVVYREGDKIWYIKGGSAPQILAENVTGFSISRPDGGNVDFRLEFSESSGGGRTYASDYHVTPRNGISGSTGSDMNVAASIYAEDEVTLEPGQEYPLSVRVMGTADREFSVESLTGNTDTATTCSADVTNGYVNIRVGANERADSFHFTIKAHDSNVTHPVNVTVNIRRVSAVSVNGFKTSGTTNKAGAVYKVTANLTGTNLEKVPGVWYDVDYADPYTAEWTFAYNGIGDDGNPVSFDGYFEVVESGVENNVPYVMIRSTRDLAKSPKLVVTCTALHPEGHCTSAVASGASTGQQTNKTGTDYDTVQGTWELEYSAWKRNGKLDIAVHHLSDDNFNINADGSIMYKWNATVKFTAYDSAGNLLTNLTGTFDPWQREQHYPIKADLDLNNIRDKWDLTLMPYHETNLVQDWGPSYSLPYILAYYNTPATGFNREWYIYNASPTFVNQSLGVAGYQIELEYQYLDESGNLVNETVYEDYQVEEVSVLYRNSSDVGCSWQRENKIFVTAADSITDYKVHFQFDKGWDENHDDYYFIDLKRFVGVVADEPGYINDVRRDITVTGNERAEEVYDGDSVLTFTLTASDKAECKALADKADGTIKMIYEYNPFLGRLRFDPKTKEELLAENPSWASDYDANYNAALAADPLDPKLYKERAFPMNVGGVTLTQEIMDRIKGCEGHVIFCFKDPNIDVRGSVTPKVMYCPTLTEYGPVYYIDDTTRFIISSATAEYQEQSGGVWNTTANLTWNGTGWTAN